MLQRIQCLYRDFAEAEATRRRVEDVQLDRLQRQAAGRTSRRAFLQAAGVAAAAALGAPAPLFAASAPRIAIVGGGIAGLNAALTLLDAGYASTVYEASSRIGGRMHSDTTSWENGQVTEHCGEMIDAGHKTILKLAQRLDIPAVNLSSAEPPRSVDTYHFFGQYYSRTQANSDFKPVFEAVKQDLKAADYPTLYNDYTPGALALDRTSVREWIARRVPGGLSSPMGRLLDVAYTVEYGGETDTQSSLNLIYMLGFQSGGSFRLFGELNDQYRLTGGNDKLPAAIAEALPRGSIQLGTQLTSIAKNADGTYALNFAQGSKNLAVTADRVILALPFSVLRNLDYKDAGFSEVKVAGIRQLGYATNVKLHLQFQGRPWDQPGPWGNGNGTSFSDMGYQSTWDGTRAQPGSTGILVHYTGGDVGASYVGDPSEPSVVEAHARDFLNQIEAVYPGLSTQWGGRATLDVPARNPYLLGSYSYWKVGQYTLFGGSEGERSGKCHFAGEHCSRDFQGLMEGGAQEGARAANEILNDYKSGIVP